MTSANTIRGHYDIELKKELDRMCEGMKKIGIRSPTKLEASWLIAKRNKKVIMSSKELKKLISEFRGIK